MSEPIPASPLPEGRGEQVERIAKALAARDGEDCFEAGIGDPERWAIDEEDREFFRGTVRAVLAELTDPPLPEGRADGRAKCSGDKHVWPCGQAVRPAAPVVAVPGDLAEASSSDLAEREEKP